MRRGAPLKRRTPLRAKRPLSRRARPPTAKNGAAAGPRLRAVRAAAERLRTRRAEPGYAEWHAPQRGKCAVCRRPGPLVRHHVLLEQTIRRYGGDPWDLRWSLLLGRHCACHGRHHVFGVRDTRIDFKHVPAEAVRLAREVMGEGPAEDYFRRHYRNYQTEGGT